MKLFIKILLFVFVALVANVKVTSAIIAFPNIQEAASYSSFQSVTLKTICKVIENDLGNCCQNGLDLVNYRNWGIGVEADAAKGGANAFKSFTASNYRHNLQVLTGKSGVGMDAHHIFPQAQRFQQHFNKVGLNIHDPKNLIWWQSGAHRSASGAYNKAWDGFFRQYPNANLQQIQNFGNSLIKSYGF